MPSSSEELRKLFNFGITDENGIIVSDGIMEAEKVIIDAGGSIIGNGIIRLPEEESKCTELVFQATQFLFEEWDYALE